MFDAGWNSTRITVWGVIRASTKQTCHFADDIFKCIFLNGSVWILIKISLKFQVVPKVNNIPALVQIMAWYQPGDQPLSEPIMVSLLMHICVTWPQWINSTYHFFSVPVHKQSQYHACWCPVSWTSEAVISRTTILIRREASIKQGTIGLSAWQV